MNLKLSDNIRAFRKEHSLTQQQLADALGITPGAVYKWEANLSAPDLSLLVELADADAALESLRAAKALAKEFDRMPNYRVNSVRFVSTEQQATAFDDFGATALDGILHLIKEFNSQALTALWEEISREG